MKIIAIICEYNPFHSGHKYQIDELRRHFGGDTAVIAIMSGSFVQRGDAAVFDKYARAEMAVRCGCDLVLELPAPWSMASAEFFARGGVELAAALGVVDILAFGSESGDIAALSEVAERLDSDEFTTAFEAAKLRSPEKQVGVLRGEVYRTLYGDVSAFTSSNDLLAVEYLRAMQPIKKITPYAVKRVGSSYNADELSTQHASATAIRRAIYNNEANSIYAHIPEPAAEIIRRELAAERLYRLANIDSAAVAFLRLDWQRMSGKMEVSGGIENRLHAASLHECTIDGIVEAACERRYSASRLRRALLGSMLGFTMRNCEEVPHFTSLLAANVRGRELLSIMRKTSSVAILSKPSDARRLDSTSGERTAYEQFERAMAAERLYQLCTEKPAARVENLYSRRAIML